jgi:hypothetical protein
MGLRIFIGMVKKDKPSGLALTFKLARFFFFNAESRTMKYGNGSLLIEKVN